MTRWIVTVLLVCGVASVAQGQTTITANRFRLIDGPCAITSSNGSPDKLVFSVCPVLTTAAATNLTLNPTGDLVLGPTGTDILPDTGYTQNLGALSNKYLTLHAAELWVETLVAQNTIATIGGRVLVAPTTTLTADLTAGATSISVKHNEMANGDRVYLEANGKVEFLAITSAPSGGGPYTYTVTRNLDGSGANEWYAGDAILNTGTTGDGFIDLYSVAGVLSGSGPSMVGNVRTGTTYNNIAPRWAIGNLNGLYGYGVTTYGTAFGDSTATNVTIDATNGLRIRSGTTNKLVADTSGNLSLTGDLSIGSGGVLRMGGATSYSAGTGVWLGDDGGTYKMRIGNPSGNRLTWDGTALSVYGNGSGLTSIGPGSLTVGYGRNMIRNSDCVVGTNGWSAFHSGGLPIIQGRGASGYNLNNTGNDTCYFWINDTPAGGTYSRQYLTTVIPIAASGRYEASAYLGVRNATNALVKIQWLEADGTTLISETSGNTCTVAGGTRLTDFCRSGVVATAPANAYNARLLVDMNHTATLAPVTYHVHNYFGEAGSGQTELTPWGPGGITSIVGGMIEANTIVADNIAANTITAAKIAASTITATEIAASTITGAKIAASTITASNLSVSQLHSISADLGTITAGTISGTTINAGTSNSVVLNTNGLSLTAGSSDWHKVKWSDSSTIASISGTITVYGDKVSLTASGGSAYGLETSNAIGGVTIRGVLNVSTLTGTGSRAVCVDSSGGVYAASGTTCP